MDLEQSIHAAQSVELSIVQGETVKWTVFKVMVEGHALEFTAFGDLPLAVNVYDDEPIGDLVGYLAVLGGRIDAAHDARRAAEKACQELRDKLNAALGDASEATEGKLYGESLLADAQSEAIEQTAVVENLEAEAHGFRETIDGLRDELRQSRAIMTHLDERGSI